MVPKVVAELGPGLSLGAGLAALICGAERYIALDVARFAPLAEVLPVFDRLVVLFLGRQRPNNASGFPAYAHSLDAAGFPSDALPEEYMAEMLHGTRISRLRGDLQAFVQSGGQESAHIVFRAPWRVEDVLPEGEIDFLFSHSVLQHVTSVRAIWQKIGALLRAGGVCSHQINFDSHGTAAAWNGHWACSEALWRIALGRKTFLINREPLSTHVTAAKAGGHLMEAALTFCDHNGLSRLALAPRWRELVDEDVLTRGAFLVARKQQ